MNGLEWPLEPLMFSLQSVAAGVDWSHQHEDRVKVCFLIGSTYWASIVCWVLLVLAIQKKRERSGPCLPVACHLFDEADVFIREKINNPHFYSMWVDITKLPLPYISFQSKLSCLPQTNKQTKILGDTPFICIFLEFCSITKSFSRNAIT